MPSLLRYGYATLSHPDLLFTCGSKSSFRARLHIGVVLATNVPVASVSPAFRDRFLHLVEVDVPEASYLPLTPDQLCVDEGILRLTGGRAGAVVPLAHVCEYLLYHADKGVMQTAYVLDTRGEIVSVRAVWNADRHGWELDAVAPKGHIKGDRRLMAPARLDWVEKMKAA